MNFIDLTTDESEGGECRKEEGVSVKEEIIGGQADLGDFIGGGEHQGGEDSGDEDGGNGSEDKVEERCGSAEEETPA
eukprot:CAMPEP_0119127222 /NCGR_PEP_ID=MMETSP1310-20130426/5857_1 /TAXON_ID=464262 /ORGANISM="Genus nov. species nov., Strain RCC2339" /LENGTH=76 /DNA_ID=CAMNT_0007117465 /DNA_START=108 /DNA_END=335 /DNA_ORIENTATION=-